MAEDMEIVRAEEIKSGHPVYKFIVLNEKNEIECSECGHKFPKQHAGNIRKHLQKKHKKISAELDKLMDEFLKSKSDATENDKQRAHRGKNKENLIKVMYDVAAIKMGLVEMCSVNMCSFRQLKNSGFSRIMAPIIAASRKCNIPLSTQPDALHEYSKAEFLKMQNVIKDELKGRLFSVMTDATTTQNRSILGIAAQFIENDAVVVRTLAMRRVVEDPSGVNLSNVIKMVLFEYGVNAACVYSITTDNEASIQKCVRDTAASQNTLLEDYFLNNLDDDESFDRVLEMEKQNAESNFELFLLGVRCAAHTLELGVKDTISKKKKRTPTDPYIKYVNAIDAATTVVSKLRTTKMKIAIDSEELLMPVAVIEVRWSSANSMLQRLFMLRTFIENQAKADAAFVLDWPLLLEMGAGLDLVATTITAIQRENIYLSDIYVEWLVLIDQLKELRTEYSRALLGRIRERFKNICGPDCLPMLACIWMDPRYQLSLDAEEKDIARNHLIALYERISNTKASEIEEDAVEDGLNANIWRREKLMKEYENKSNQNALEVRIGDILESFNSMARISPKIDPLKYWSSKSDAAPQMYTLSKIVFAVPGTQAAIERNFSALNKTLTKFRAALSDETLERILFMKCNHSLFGQNLFDEV